MLIYLCNTLLLMGVLFVWSEMGVWLPEKLNDKLSGGRVFTVGTSPSLNLRQ